MDKISFVNWTSEPFTGRFGGQDYVFEAGQKELYDADKHYMLLLLSKQLADKELLHKVKSIGRNPQNMETWGKSLDENGEVFVITGDLRKDLMRKAIGNLVDTPIVTPEIPDEEAGATQKTTDDVDALKREMGELKELLQQAVANNTNGHVPNVVAKAEVPASESSKAELTNSLLRDSLIEMAQEKGLTVPDDMPKDQIIELIANANKQPVA